MRVLDLGITGLDLALGGGIRLLERVRGRGESTTLLIRGPAGSGKTVLGTQLAANIARRLETDVAYGCVELLPVELRAQHESIRGPSATEKVVILNEQDPGMQPDTSQVCIYSGLLDLGEGEAGEAVSRLEEAIEALLEAALKRAGREPRVLVIDSLSDGYGLGASAPRVLADTVCKLAAARGLVAVLLEEIAETHSSVWQFAVDTVLELMPAGPGEPWRRLLVAKHRFGPSESGPHRFQIRTLDGAEVFASESCYTRDWVRNRVLDQLRLQIGLESSLQPWSSAIGIFQALDWLPAFRECVTAIVGSSDYLYLYARLMGRETGDQLRERLGPGIVYSISKHHAIPPAEAAEELEVVGLDTTWGGLDFLEHLWAMIRQQRESEKQPSRIIIGDLRDLEYHPDRSGMGSAIRIAATMLYALKIPLILFESGVETMAKTSMALALANVALKIDSGPELMDVHYFTSHSRSLRVRQGIPIKSPGLVT
jgi:KaiC/GvpD/RAD55 family RecA-like ATPase